VAASKRPLRVFLCHAHADRDRVHVLYKRLANDGVDAWLDKEKLLPGQDWELEIKKAVREADVVVVCLSKQFNQAGFRQKEVRLALDTAMEKPEGEIFIIPSRLEECDNLQSLGKWHWVDLFEKDGYKILLRALRAREDKIQTSSSVINLRKSVVPHTKKNLVIATRNKENKKKAHSIIVSTELKGRWVENFAGVDNKKIVWIGNDQEGKISLTSFPSKGCVYKKIIYKDRRLSFVLYGIGYTVKYRLILSRDGQSLVGEAGNELGVHNVKWSKLSG